MSPVMAAFLPLPCYSIPSYSGMGPVPDGISAGRVDGFGGHLPHPLAVVASVVPVEVASAVLLLVAVASAVVALVAPAVVASAVAASVVAASAAPVVVALAVAASVAPVEAALAVAALAAADGKKPHQIS